MNPTIPLVLAALSGELGVADRQKIERFSTTWGVKFALLRAIPEAQPPEGALPSYPSSEPIVARVEELLDSARGGVARLDENESREALGAAEALLLRHPELPQAAWLRAEHWTIAAELAEATGALGAAELRARARAVEGPRISTSPEGEPAISSSSADVLQRVTFSGLHARDTVEWDGVRATPPVSALPGEHHARVLRRGFPMRGVWVTVGDRSEIVAIELPEVEPCSAEDLAGTRASAGAPHAEPGVSCERWAVARRVAGVLELALCRRSECGSWNRLAPEISRAPARAAPAVTSAGLPRWATVALAGAGAVLATSLVLWQTGAFEPQPPARERWVYRGFESR